MWEAEGIQQHDIFVRFFIFTDFFACPKKPVEKKRQPNAGFLISLTSDNQGGPRLRDKPSPHFYPRQEK